MMAYRNAADVVESLTTPNASGSARPTAGRRCPGSGRRPRRSSRRRGPAGNPTCSSNCARRRRSGWRRDPGCVAWRSASALELVGRVGADRRDDGRPRKALGHEYCALTDHSPRLKIANGLSARAAARSNSTSSTSCASEFAPMRILTGIEVDILDDGTLDQEPELLDRLDVVVASVHSKLSMDAAVDDAADGARGVRPARRRAGALHRPARRRATAGMRPESKFDAEKVFTACRDHGTAVEINSRPERRDPPTPAAGAGAGDRLPFLHRHRRARPGPAGLPGLRRAARARQRRARRRIVNTWPVEQLLEWTRA